MRKTALVTMLLLGLSAPALAEECTRDFGPWDENGCGAPPYTPPATERIPIAGWNYPAEFFMKQADGADVFVSAPVSVQVIDDFVFMYATLPNGTKVSGVSNQCVQSVCTYLANFARLDMEYKLDAVLRFAAKQSTP